MFYHIVLKQMLLQHSSDILKAIKHGETTASKLMTKTTISRECTSTHNQRTSWTLTLVKNTHQFAVFHQKSPVWWESGVDEDTGECTATTSSSSSLSEFTA